MANLVKIKRNGIIVFTLILFFFCIVALKTLKEENQFIEDWTPNSTLSLSDFKLYPPILENEFDAVIDVHFLSNHTSYEYKNKTHNIYRIRTVIDRKKSYFSEYAFSEDLLTHEKYHANLAAAIARKANLDLESKENITETEFNKKFSYYNKKLDFFQNLYDTETSHSKNKPAQKYWEYKIDSMYYSYDKLNTKDEYSGASCFFPVQPKIEIDKDSISLTKFFFLEKYNLTFSFFIDYDKDCDTLSLENDFTKALSKKGMIQIKTKKSVVNSICFLEAEWQNISINKKFFYKMVYKFPFLYQMSVCYPLDSKNNIFYERMKSQFLNSFEISNNEKEWIDKYKKKQEKICKRQEITHHKKKGVNAVAYTYNRYYSDYSIIYHKPIIYNQNLIIPFIPISHKISELNDIVLIVNNKYIFYQEPDSTDLMFVLNLNENHIENIDKLIVGYTLKSDSIKKCYNIHGSPFLTIDKIK